MNRKMKRASEANGRRLQKKPWNDFSQLTRGEINASSASESFKQSLSSCYQNNKYVVFIFNNKERNGRRYTKVMCRRSDSKPIFNWNDLFRIKNELFGEEVEALTFLPKKSELVDDANLYWFWIEE